MAHHRHASGLAGLRIPQAQRPVLTAGNDPRAVAVERHAIHPALAAPDRRTGRLAGRRVPKAQAPVAAAGDHAATVVTEGNRIHLRTHLDDPFEIPQGQQLAQHRAFGFRVGGNPVCGEQLQKAGHGFTRTCPREHGLPLGTQPQARGTPRLEVGSVWLARRLVGRPQRPTRRCDGSDQQQHSAHARQARTAAFSQLPGFGLDFGARALLFGQFLGRDPLLAVAGFAASRFLPLQVLRGMQALQVLRTQARVTRPANHPHQSVADQFDPMRAKLLVHTQQAMPVGKQRQLLAAQKTILQRLLDRIAAAIAVAMNQVRLPPFHSRGTRS